MLCRPFPYAKETLHWSIDREEVEGRCNGILIRAGILFRTIQQMERSATSTQVKEGEMRRWGLFLAMFLSVAVVLFPKVSEQTRKYPVDSFTTP